MTSTNGALVRYLVGYALLTSGCGRPLLSDSAYDSPLFSLHGHLNPSRVDVDELLIAIVWVDPAQLRDDVPVPTDTIRMKRLDAQFDYSLYAPPPALAMRRLVDPATGSELASFAVGELVVVEDSDGNDRFAVAAIASGSEILPPDQYRGGQAQFVVSYVDKPLVNPKDELPELQGLLTASPGYHLVGVDCATPATPFTYSVIDPDRVDVEMTILEAGSSQLPFLRSCLRTHPL